jgi:hypothetical protein
MARRYQGIQDPRSIQSNYLPISSFLKSVVINAVIAGSILAVAPIALYTLKRQLALYFGLP